MVPLEPETPPDLAGHRVFIGAGRFDQMVRPDNTERLAQLLREFGADVTIEWQQAGHELTQADVDLARGWLTPSA
jgi:predicted esterase